MKRIILGFVCVGALLTSIACNHDRDGNGGDLATSHDIDGFIDVSPPDLAGGGFIAIDGGITSACATDTQKATLKPLDLYLMVDSSGSMTELTGAAGSPTKWSSVGSAIGSFVNDPASAGIGVGLQFFPIVQAGTSPQTCSSDATCGALAPCIHNKACAQSGAVTFCASDSDCSPGVSCLPVGTCSKNPAYACFSKSPACGFCNYYALSYCSGRESCMASDYKNPTVAFATLPTAASSITSALASHMPDGLTPTAPALQGSIDAALAQSIANPDHVVAVVLVTDGFPTECSPQDIPSIAAIAGSGLSATPSVKTFVIGVFSTDEQVQATANMDQIASAGGSGSAFVIPTTGSVTSAFLAALDSIRGAALPCEFTLPVPATGTPDYGLVNVQFTGGGASKIVPHASSTSACDPTLGGWFYDVDPSSGTPSKVVLCPKSCDAVRADAGGQIDIVQGCKTIDIPVL